MIQPDELIEQIVACYDEQVGMLIPMMQDLQAECGYLPAEHLRRLAQKLHIPITRIYGVATFYASFRLFPKGEHTITLCLGTVCYLKGANRISEAIQQEFRVTPGGTSEDKKFTFSPVNCLGACALAPVMIVDNEYYGGLSPESAIEILHNIAKGKKPPREDQQAEKAKSVGKTRKAEKAKSVGKTRKK